MSKKISGNDLLDSLNWRYATKIFDPAKKISAEDWSALEKALILSPSSYGLQPWKFLVIQDKVIREKLLPLSWNQKQVTDCSHYVIFLGKLSITERDTERFVQSMASTRNIPVESLDFYKNMMQGDLVKGPRHAWIKEWAARQVYIALGNFMTSAALMHIDTCPMEGIDPAKYDEVLGIKGSDYQTLVACAAGYRSPEDKYAHLPKVRYSAAELVQNR